MTPEEKILSDSLTRLFTRLCRPEDVRRGEGRWMGELWDALAEMGVPWLGIPEDLGGSGGEVEDAALAVRVAAGHAVPLPVAESALVIGPALAAAGIELPEGAPVTCMIADLEVDGDHEGPRVSGTVPDVPWASDAAALAGVCALDGVGRLVLVRREDVRIESGRNIAGEPRDRVILDRVRPMAWAATDVTAERLRARGAAARAVMISGAADRVLEISVEHARTRRQFGKPIGSFQAVAHLLARIAGAAAAAQSAAHLAVGALRTDDIELAGSAKTVASEAAGTVADLAHQLHGAIGLTREHQLHLYTRRLWAWRSEYGSDRYWARRCGETLVSTSSDPWRDLVASR